MREKKLLEQIELCNPEQFVGIAPLPQRSTRALEAQQTANQAEPQTLEQKQQLS